MEPIERLFESDGLPRFEGLPARLEELYGGPFGLELPRLYANFVSSIDGVVALERLHSASMISRKNEGDRFTMALLRACAGAVLIGAATVRADPGHRWTAEHLHREAAGDFAELRARLGLPPSPELAVISGSGDLDPSEPTLAEAVVFTSDRGAERLSPRLPSRATIVSMGSDVSVSEVVRTLWDRGHRSILCEGGPSIIGQLLEEGLVDELFVTISPVLAGRIAGERRPGMVEGVALLPDHPVWGSLRSIRRHGEHVLLRYDLTGGGE